MGYRGNREDPHTTRANGPSVKGTTEFSPMLLFLSITKKPQKRFLYIVSSY